MANDTSAMTRTGFFAVGLLLLAFWMLLHPYGGIGHDAILYTLGALARVHPDLLGQDMFLRFGSQDQFTIFSPLYAAAIRRFDLEPAAALLAFAGQAAFLSSVWLFARRCMPAPLALLSLGLLIVIPSGYGGQMVFKYLENFLTPRLFAQALTLAALAAALAGRPVLACAAAVAAVAFHPIMAAAGIVFLGFYWVVLPRPKMGLALCAAGLAALLVAALTLSWGPFARFDAQWLQLLLDRAGFLFLSVWSFQDWIRALIPLSMLAIGALLCEQPAIRKLCIAALLTASAGLLLTVLFCDLLSTVGLTQVQPWRWTWLAQVISIVVIPPVLRDCWRQGWIARTAVLLAACAWLFRGQNFNGVALVMIVLAILAALTGERRWNIPRSKAVFGGAVALAALSLSFCLLEKWQLLTTDGDISLPETMLERLTLLAGDGVVPVLLLTLVWWRARHSPTRVETGTLAVAAAVACIAAAPSAWGYWNDRHLLNLRDDFASWRQQIPPGAEVAWSAMPLGAWYWLERPSFVSASQTAGIVFSRQTALEGYRRTRLIAPLLIRDEYGWASPEDMALPLDRKLPTICGRGGIEFIVSSEDLGIPPLGVVVPYPAHPNIRLRLYRCPDAGN